MDVKPPLVPAREFIVIRRTSIPCKGATRTTNTGGIELIGIRSVGRVNTVPQYTRLTSSANDNLPARLPRTGGEVTDDGLAICVVLGTTSFQQRVRLGCDHSRAYIVSSLVPSPSTIYTPALTTRPVSAVTSGEVTD